MRHPNKLQLMVATWLFTCFAAGSNQILLAIQSDESKELDAKAILVDQTKIANQYKLLEEKLFALYQYERDNNPTRAKLLERAYGLSKQQMTSAQLQQIVRLLGSDRLKDAEQNQEAVLGQLQQLLVLLESEDRGKRVRDDIRRHQEYLKEVERLLRIQKSIRAQAESDGDLDRLANSEARAINRAKKLANEIERNESSGNDQDDNADSSATEQKSETDGRKNEQGEKPTEKGARNDKQDSKSNNKSGNPNQAKPSGKQNETPDGDQPQNEPDSDEPESESPSSNDSPQDSVRNRIRAAERRMRQAQQDLEAAKRKDSVEEMKAAEIEIAKAKKELEEILRQLREEEVERMLAGLETRFRKMLEQQVRLSDSTSEIDTTPTADRGTDFEIRAGKLGKDQLAISIEADRALLLLREDGSSVAFPKTVEQMQTDMVQVSKRLAGAKTGTVTQSIQQDVIETLKFLIDSLVVTQKDMERMKRKGQKPQKAGQPGEQALVNSLAELKMLRGLQKRIYQRHERYAKLLDNPEDPVGATQDPDIQAALERLSLQQQDLTEITRDIVNGLTK